MDKKEWTDLTPSEMKEELKNMGMDENNIVIDETKYPMSFSEFEGKYIQKVINDCKKQYHLKEEEILNDLNNYLKDNPTAICDDYVDCCEYYDDCKEHYNKELDDTGKYIHVNGRNIIAPNTVFKVHLNFCVYEMKNELYFF